MKITQQIWFRQIIVASILIILAAFIFYFFIFDPIHNAPFFPSCSFKASTGLDCVGCGIQRSIHALLHGHFMMAFDYNPLFILLLPMLLYYGAYAYKRFVYRQAPPNNIMYSHLFGKILILVFILFLILRNLPYPIFSWMNSSL